MLPTGIASWRCVPSAGEAVTWRRLQTEIQVRRLLPPLAVIFFRLLLEQPSVGGMSEWWPITGRYTTIHNLSASRGNHCVCQGNTVDRFPIQVGAIKVINLIGVEAPGCPYHMTFFVLAVIVLELELLAQENLNLFAKYLETLARL